MDREVREAVEVREVKKVRKVKDGEVREFVKGKDQEGRESQVGR